MESFTPFEADNYQLEDLVKMKNDRKIFVVFSTFGEREAELIYQKVLLLKAKLGDYIDRIILSHRRKGDGEEITEQKAKKAYSEIDIVICNDYKVHDMGDEKGKGADMRRTLYYIQSTYGKEISPEKIVVVFLDADVVPEYFGEHFVTGLTGPVLEGYHFAKASFWRAMGRVKKFVAQPLFSVIDHPKLRDLRNFAYPLSGEVAGTLDFFQKVHFWQIYGVETGINIDACMGNYRVADVNLGKYDHEHHGVVDIQKMAFGIIRTYMKQLIDYGIIELKDGAAVSNEFNASLITENSSRESLEFDLSEEKYPPLKSE